MNGPSQDDINEMKRLHAILNNLDEDDLLYDKPAPRHEVRVSPPSAMLAGSDADQIKRHILAIENMMPEIIEESKTDHELGKAIITEKLTDTSYQVGTWKIEKFLVETAGGKKEPSYHVSNVVTQQRAEPVFVYESAQAIMKTLNQGHNLHDKEIDAIMELDEEYQRLRDKALQEKAVWQRAKNNNLEWKQQLYESKFNSSQYQALYIKERIKNFLLK